MSKDNPIYINLDDSDNDDDDNVGRNSLNNIINHKKIKKTPSPSIPLSKSLPKIGRTSPLSSTTTRIASNNNSSSNNRLNKSNMLASIHEKRLSTSSNKDIKQKQILNNIKDNNNNNDDNDDDDDDEVIIESINKSNNYPKTTTTTTTSTKNNSHPLSNNNEPYQNGRSNFNYEASSSLKQQMSQIRSEQHSDYRKNKLKGQQFFNMNDIEKMSKKSKDDKLYCQSIQTTIPQKPPNNIHSIGSTLRNPEYIGRQALEFSNEFRKSLNLPPMIWNQQIYFIGVEHSKNMADGKVGFGHDGFDDRIKRYPFPFTNAAENVAMNNCDATVAKTSVDGWIKSPGHRKNLVGNFNICAIGVYQGTNGNWYLTQLFARSK